MISLMTIPYSELKVGDKIKENYITGTLYLEVVSVETKAYSGLPIDGFATHYVEFKTIMFPTDESPMIQSANPASPVDIMRKVENND